MRAVVVTPPEAIVVWDDLNAHLRLGNDLDQRSYVEGLAAAATALIDGPTGWMGRALGMQTIDVFLNGFVCTDLQLPYPEIVGVTSVSYVDPDGVVQTMDAADYELAGRLLSAKWGTSWPATSGQPEAVTVRYQAGYASDNPALATIRAAILIMVGDLYNGRESFAAASTIDALPSSMTVQNLLAPHRVYF